MESDKVLRKQMANCCCYGTERNTLIRFFFYLTIFYLTSLRISEGASIQEVKSTYVIDSAKFETALDQVQRTKRSFALRRLRRVTDCCRNCNQNERRHYEIECSQIYDANNGFQWHVHSRRRRVNVKGVLDSRRHWWISLKRERIIMFALESHNHPGLFHFAEKFATDHVRLSEALPLPDEIDLTVEDSRYFRTGRTAHTSDSYIEHIASERFANVDNHSSIGLKQDLAIIDNDWKICQYPQCPM